MSSTEAIREEIRAFIAENWSREITVREWWRRLADAGLSAPSWPAPWGRGYSGAQSRIVLEEFAAVGVIAAPDTRIADFDLRSAADRELVAHDRAAQVLL